MHRLAALLSLTFLFLLGFALPLQAQDGLSSGLSMEVKSGFDSFQKADHWSPVTVIVSNSGEDMTLDLQVEDNSYYNDGSIYRYPLDLPHQSRKQVTLYIPTQHRQLTLNLVDDNDKILLSKDSQAEVLDPVDFLVGVVASDKSLLNGLAGLTPNSNRVAVAHLSVNELPTNPHAWTGLDMLVFNDVDTSQLSADQLGALSYWVSQGGRLVIGGGPNVNQTIAGLGTLPPFSDTTIETLEHPLPELSRFIRATTVAQIVQDNITDDPPPSIIENRGPYVAAIPINPAGTAKVKQGDWPLIISKPHDGGQIHYIALDLSLAPLDTLGGNENFLPKLVDSFDTTSGHFSDIANWHEMRQGLALIPSLSLPTPGMVALYLLLYILALGPINYYILARLKRKELAWLTLPLIILIFCAVGYLSSFRLRGGRPLMRQITIVQSEANAPIARVDSFVGIYSPNRTAYDINLDATALVSNYDDSRPDAKLYITPGSTTTIDDMQADVGGMPSINFRSHTTPPAISSQLRRNGIRIEGVIVNNTDQPITQAYLVANHRIMKLGTLSPGENKISGQVRTYSYIYNDTFYDFDENDSPDNLIRLASQDSTIRAVLGINNYNFSGLELPGSYLLGWQQGSPVQVTLPNHQNDTMEDTLLVVGLSDQLY